MASGQIVIVGREDEQCEPLAGALEAHGWHVERCVGPARTRCPLLTGTACAVRDSADAAVVYVDARRSLAANLPLARCAARPSGPSVVVLEGQVDPPRVDSGFAVIGSLRHPATMVGALEDLVGAREAAGAR